MRILHPRLRGPRLALVALPFLVVGASAAGVFPALLPFDGFTSPLPAEAVAAPHAPAVIDSQGVEAEVITLRPEGFDPPEVSRPAGRVLFVVDNKSGAEEVVLRLDAADGSRLHEARARRNTRALRRVVNLQPGAYTLTEADHPEWVCRITVTH